jgi:L-threonylcarbamoyladenylate synthase
LQGGETDVGLESTVVDCTGRAPVVLRSGAITLEQLREVVPSTRLNRARIDGAARSPGMKHRHYAPRARVMLVETLCDSQRSPRAAFIGLRPPLLATGFGLVALCRDIEQYAHVLFRFFRECDAAELETIFCETVPECGLGVALMDRLRRAAEPEEKAKSQIRNPKQIRISR